MIYYKKETKGITLIALIITIIVLLILAGVSLSAVFSESGIFSRAEKAGNKYNEAKARESLETVLLGIAQYEKRDNPKYDQEEFLDKLIKKEIEGADVKGDVAIVGGWGFELDRSVPKIKTDLGQVDKLVFPTVTVSEAQVATDCKTATFKVKALEETNGINKIEIWLNGEKLNTYDRTYSNDKTEITEDFTVNRNGLYTVKVYGKLMASKTVKVEGLVPAIKFTPNGSNEWKREHSTTIKAEQTGETITEIKYLWKTGENEPQTSEFTEDCTDNSTITGKELTGKYHLWILLKTESEKINVCGSNEFWFDNEGPEVTLTSDPTSENSFTLTATAEDIKSGIAKYEFYMEGVRVDTQGISEGTASYQWNGTEMSKKDCSVIVYDTLGNKTEKEVEGRTKLYAWMKCNINYQWYVEESGPDNYSDSNSTSWTYGSLSSRPSQSSYFNSSTGKFNSVGSAISVKASSSTAGKSYDGYRVVSSGSSAVLVHEGITVWKGNGTPYMSVSRSTTHLYARKRETGHDTTGPLVYSTERDAYPDDGKSGESWYIYSDIK